jgi:acyl CoA:acetate/3-ketoacid CoA transferase beta subunit
VRNEVTVPTLVGGYLTMSNEINTFLAAGRVDLCIFGPLEVEVETNKDLFTIALRDYAAFRSIA